MSLENERAQFIKELDAAPEAALGELERRMAAQSGSAESIVKRALIAIRAGDLDGAQRLLATLKRSPEDPWVAYATAGLLLQRGDYAGALPLLELAQQLVFARSDVVLFRAVALNGLQRFSEVLKLPDSPELDDATRGSLLMIQAYAAHSTGDSELAARLSSRARRFGQRGIGEPAAADAVECVKI